ncbi:hypothetical protein DKG71_01505 [Streptomyces sp. NEAU-S7GS2]|nr:hypothetical protein DKG71_01505 [Streptomyces sp. NEAU-S7GS2]
MSPVATGDTARSAGGSRGAHRSFHGRRLPAGGRRRLAERECAVDHEIAHGIADEPIHVPVATGGDVKVTGEQIGPPPAPVRTAGAGR